MLKENLKLPFSKLSKLVNLVPLAAQAGTARNDRIRHQWQREESSVPSSTQWSASLRYFGLSRGVLAVRNAW